MIRKLCKDPMFLSLKSNKATKEDISLALDLLDTLNAYRDRCVGMACNMIGINKCIIVFIDQLLNKNVIMFNPRIIQKANKYETEEGCLCLPGVRKTERYQMITVEFQDMNFVKTRKEYFGYTAQIIQHEIDMTNGILI